MGKSLKIGFFMLIEKILRIVINPYWRASLLRVCGATIGKNVRVYEVVLFNLGKGFNNLHIGDDVYIAPGCRLDLEGRIFIGKGATLSPGVSIISHSDPGSTHNSPLCSYFKPMVEDVNIGEYCWIGCNSVILAGSKIGEQAVVGACSLVKGVLMPKCVYFGTVAKKIREL